MHQSQLVANRFPLPLASFQLGLHFLSTGMRRAVAACTPVRTLAPSPKHVVTYSLQLDTARGILPSRTRKGAGPRSRKTQEGDGPKQDRLNSPRVPVHRDISNQVTENVQQTTIRQMHYQNAN
jgi:hypothetical protein